MVVRATAPPGLSYSVLEVLLFVCYDRLSFLNVPEHFNLRQIFNVMWDRMKIIASIVGDVEATVIATLFYFTILVPFGLLARLMSDPLNRKADAKHQAWIERPSVHNDLDSAKRQG